MSSDIIRDLQLKISAYREQAEDYEEVIKNLKYQHWLDVENSAKELGLTNETKRKLALDTRLDTDETYTRLKKELKALRQQISLLEIDEAYERRKHQREYAQGLKDAAGVRLYDIL